MYKKIVLTVICTIIIITVNKTLTQSPLSHCEAFNALRIAMIMNIEELKHKAELGDMESALALIDLSKGFSESPEAAIQNPLLKKLKMLNSSGYLLADIKKAFSEQTYTECKHIFEPTNDTTNNEESPYNDRED